MSLKSIRAKDLDVFFSPKDFTTAALHTWSGGSETFYGLFTVERDILNEGDAAFVTGRVTFSFKEGDSLNVDKRESVLSIEGVDYTIAELNLPSEGVVVLVLTKDTV